MADLNLTSMLSGGSKKKALAVPDKLTVNFVHQKKKMDPVRLVLLIVLAVVVLCAIAKFGIIDQEVKRTNAKNALTTKQNELAVINAKLNDYDELAAKYGRYSYGWMSAAETGLVSRMEILDLLESQIMNVAVVENYSVSDNILTVNLHGITLERASQVVKQLEESPLVKTASVYSASAEDAREASIFMSVVLTKEASEE